MYRLRFNSSDPIFFTADTHFGHANIIRFGELPFVNITEKDELQIKNWNLVVPKDGIVFHAGDLALKCHPKRLSEILYQLNGKIYLCEGSHEKDAMQHKERFERINDTFYLTIENVEIFISHYCHKVWPKSHYGSWQIHGHSHGHLDKYDASEGKILDVAVESHKYTPLSYKQVTDIMNTRPLNFNDLSKGGNHVQR